MSDSNVLEVCPGVGCTCYGNIELHEPVLHSCGYPEGTFACKIRHVHLNTGDAKAAKD